MKTVIYSKMSTRRFNDLQTITRIVKDLSSGKIYAEKKPLEVSSNYASRIFDNYLLLKDKLKGFSYPCCYLENGVFISEFVEGESLESLVESSKSSEERKRYVMRFFRCLYESFDLVFEMNLSVSEHIANLNKSLSTLYSLDLSFYNIIVNENGFYLIDYEWLDEQSSVEFSLFRTFRNLTNTCAKSLFRAYYAGEKFESNLKLDYQFMIFVAGITPDIDMCKVETLEKKELYLKNAIRKVEDLEDTINRIFSSKSWKVSMFLSKVFQIVKKLKFHA